MTTVNTTNQLRFLHERVDMIEARLLILEETTTTETKRMNQLAACVLTIETCGGFALETDGALTSNQLAWLKQNVHPKGTT